MSDKQQSNDWDERWVQISDMPAGSDDPLPEFAERVRAAMEHTGNKVGRPCVMKVTIEVVSGEIARPEPEEDDDE